MKEVELAKKFIEYLESYYDHIYKEVYCYGGITDILCEHENKYIAVEVKTRLSFDVIRQAHLNRKSCEYSYIAVPWSKNMKIRNFQYLICERFGIGALSYRKHRGVNKEVDAMYSIPQYKSRIKLKDFMKESVAGAPSSSGTRVTDFQYTVRLMTEFIKSNPGCSLKQLVQSVDHHYSNNASAVSSIRQYLKGDNPIIKDFYFKNGKLFVN